MRAMAKLRPHVDAFFDKVTVNVADDEELRENRLKLLNGIREPRARSRISRASRDSAEVSCPRDGHPVITNLTI